MTTIYINILSHRVLIGDDMKKRIKLKKKTIFNLFKMRRRNLFIYLFILFTVALVFLFRFIDTKVTPVLINYAELEMRKFSNIIINRAVASEIAEGLDIEELFIITRDINDEIKTIDFNPITVNRTLTLIAGRIQQNLFHVKEGRFDLLELPSTFLSDYNVEKIKEGIIFEIPSGVVFQNSLLSNLGPKIPVRLNMVGDIISNIKTQITNYGINNALVEVIMDIELNEQIILPFTSKRINIQTSVPIAMKLIQGTVPNFYFNGMSKTTPNFILPVE